MLDTGCDDRHISRLTRRINVLESPMSRLESLSRRGLLLSLGAGGALAGGGALAQENTRRMAGPVFSEYPFQLGIASGDPLPDGFVIWTRLAPRPLEPGNGMPASPCW